MLQWHQMVGMGFGQLDGERTFHLIALTMGGQVPSVKMAAARSQMGDSLRYRQQTGAAIIPTPRLTQLRGVLRCWPEITGPSFYRSFPLSAPKGLASSSDTFPFRPISSLRNKSSRTTVPYWVSCLECYQLLLRWWRLVTPRSVSRWAITGKQRR